MSLLIRKTILFLKIIAFKIFSIFFFYLKFHDLKKKKTENLVSDLLIFKFKQHF